MTDSAREVPLLTSRDPTRLLTSSSMSFLSRIVGGCGGGSTTVSNNKNATLYRQLGVGINTEDILSERERFLVLSSRDFLRAANFALFASISARRRSARDSAPDEEDDIVKTAVDTHVYTRRMSVLGGFRAS